MTVLKFPNIKSGCYGSNFFDDEGGCPKSHLNVPYDRAEDFQPLPFVLFMDFLDSPETREIDCRLPIVFIWLPEYRQYQQDTWNFLLVGDDPYTAATSRGGVECTECEKLNKGVSRGLL
jgi:hypothetical protein